MPNKKICVSAVLDTDAKNKIETLQQKLRRIKPSGHITIATYESFDENLIIEYTKEFCKTQPKIDIAYNGVGVMTAKEPYSSFIYAIPQVTLELSNLHFDFHQKYDEHASGFTSLKHNEWNPHTSLCKYTPLKMRKCIKNFESIHGKLVGMKVVDVNDTWRVVAEFEFEG